MALRHWLQLSLTSGIGPILMRRLIDAAGGVEQACGASVALLRKIEGIGASKSQKIFESLQEAAHEVNDQMARAAAAGVKLICQDDADYPALLRSIPDPPAVLFVKGSVEPRDLNGIAIVGSRKCSYYGREQAERFGALLAGAGFTVISGGARGIDSAAHRGAMSHPQGRTIAVLGSGVDVPYPPENAALFNQIAQHGAVMSEYPLGTPPLAENFPKRNRIVSGMSRAVLVIEADERSGALITARQACDDHGRPVLALPGRVDSPTSAGTHKLIREGAALVTRLEDIVESLGPLPHHVAEPSVTDSAVAEHPAAAAPVADQAGIIVPNITQQQAEILAHFDGQPVHVDTLVHRSGLPAQVILQELTLLSLRGLVKRVDGHTYAKTKPIK